VARGAADQEQLATGLDQRLVVGEALGLRAARRECRVHPADQQQADQQYQHARQRVAPVGRQ